MIDGNRQLQRNKGLTLRAKLLLVSLTLLVVPWIGYQYQYLNTMKSYLRQAQERSLLDSARAVSLILSERHDIFGPTDLAKSAQEVNHMYVRPLKTPIILDGRDYDWEPYRNRFRFYGASHIKVYNKDSAVKQDPAKKHDPRDFSFVHAVGTYKNHLYVIFKVKDDKIVYRDPYSFRLDRSDHLQIAIQSPQGHFSRFLLATRAPGWVNAHYVPDGSLDRRPERPEVKIKGEWQETDDGGYIIEIRIPLSMIGNKIGFEIADVDDPKTRKIETVIGTAGTRHVEELGTIMLPSPEKERLLKGLAQKDVRTWVIDKNRRVIARAGTVASGTPAADRSVFSSLTRFLYRLMLRSDDDPASTKDPDASMLTGKAIDNALTYGSPRVSWRSTPGKRASILSAIYPVWNDNKVVGAVVMDQTSDSILVLQDRAVESLFNTSFTMFLVAAVILLLFATRLSSRIRRLRDDAEQAIGPDGRVQGKIAGSRAADELGDLSRSISDILERLGQYNRYLETMAGKLSHELRTPLTVVKSSIENLELQPLDKEALTYTARAHEGIERLSNILSRMSEVTRLEQSLQDFEREQFKLDKVLEGCVAGYRIAYPEQKFDLQIDDDDYTMLGVPDLVAQMLDKLVSNARDFAAQDTAVQIRLAVENDHLVIRVINQGPHLPKEMHGNLFDSMVSARKKKGDKLHLGLGLYIVRLIVDFHNGIVSASNRKNPKGVKFTITLPKRFDGGQSGVFGVP